jgi:hypothetical protein
MRKSGCALMYVVAENRGRKGFKGVYKSVTCVQSVVLMDDVGMETKGMEEECSLETLLRKSALSISGERFL